jgi:hypothetical protein
MSSVEEHSSALLAAFYASTLFQEAEEASKKEYRPLRFTRAFIEFARLECSDWRSAMKAAGYKNLDKAFGVYVNLAKQRSFSLQLLDALCIKVSDLATITQKDRLEFESWKCKPFKVTHYTMRLIPAVYHHVKFEKPLLMAQAILEVKERALRLKCHCMIESPIQLVLVNKQGRAWCEWLIPRLVEHPRSIEIKG